MKRFPNSRRPQRRAAPPRMHRGREYGRGPNPAPRGRPSGPRARDYYTEEDYGRMGRDLDQTTRRLDRGRRSEDEFDLDAVLGDEDLVMEVGEDEVEEVMEEETEGECPPGCVPAEEAGLVCHEEDGETVCEESEEEGEEKEEEEDKEEEEGEEKEASVKGEAAKPEQKEEVTAANIHAKWAPILTEADIKKIARDSVDFMLVPFDEDTQDPKYVALVNGSPLGEIRFGDQEIPAEDRPMFTDETYPKGVAGNVDHFGVAETLSTIKMRYYAAQVTEREASDAAKTQAQADLEEAYQARIAETKQRFFNNILLGVQASRKNVWLRNPFRDALRHKLAAVGVPDSVAVDIYEQAMQEAGPQYFQALLEKADEWLGTEPEAMREIAAAIEEADYTAPGDRGLYIDPMLPPQQPKEAAPYRTMAPQQQRAAAPRQDDDAFDPAKIRNALRGAETPHRFR